MHRVQGPLWPLLQCQCPSVSEEGRRQENGQGKRSTVAKIESVLELHKFNTSRGKLSARANPLVAENFGRLLLMVVRQCFKIWHEMFPMLFYECPKGFRRKVRCLLKFVLHTGFSLKPSLQHIWKAEEVEFKHCPSILSGVSSFGFSQHESVGEIPKKIICNPG